MSEVQRRAKKKFHAMLDRARIPMYNPFLPVSRGVEKLVSRRAHNPKAAGSSPVPATKWVF